MATAVSPQVKHTRPKEIFLLAISIALLAGFSSGISEDTGADNLWLLSVTNELIGVHLRPG